MSAIVSNEHREDLDKLVADPILQNMLVGLRDVPDGEIMNDAGEPLWEFVGPATEQYRKMGGEHGAFVGSVAQAIIKIRKERGRCHVPAWAERYLIFIPDGARLKELFENEDLSMSGVQSHAMAAWTAFETVRNLHEAGLLKKPGEQ